MIYRLDLIGTDKLKTSYLCGKGYLRLVSDKSWKKKLFFITYLLLMKRFTSYVTFNCFQK